MNTYQTRVIAMLKEVVVFETEHRSAFPPGSNAAKRFDDNNRFLVKIDEHLESVLETAENPNSESTPGLNPILKSAIANVRLLDAPIQRRFAEEPKVLKSWEKMSQVNMDDQKAPPSKP